MNSMNHKQIEEYLLAKPASLLDYPFGAGTAVYKVMDKMFAIIPEGKEPIQISLKCDPLLAKTLRERYETVLPGYHLNKTHWNTILMTGQLTNDELLGLVDLSYNLVVEGLTADQRQQLQPSD